MPDPKYKEKDCPMLVALYRLHSEEMGSPKCKGMACSWWIEEDDSYYGMCALVRIAVRDG